jgi:hypothetical protein
MSGAKPRVTRHSCSPAMRDLFAKAAEHPGPRLGATYLEVLKELRPDLHRKVAGTGNDPSSDERRLNAFLLWLSDHWGPEEIDIDVEVSGLMLW